MARKLTLLALLVCAAVTGFVLWGVREGSDARKSHREGVAEPPSRRHRSTPVPEPEPKPEPPEPVEGKPDADDQAPTKSPAVPGETGGLLVKITDSTGRPLVGVRVKLIGPDEDGKWGNLGSRELADQTQVAFDGLRPGHVSLWVTRGDYHRSRPVKIRAGERLELTVAMPEGATVSGTVRHIERGPLPDVILEAKTEDDPFEDTLRTTTDKEGRYTLRNVPPGRYGLKVTGKASGYEQHPRALLDIPDLGSYERDLVLGRLTLRGIVREAGTGAAISGVRVTIQEPYYAFATSADDGTYAFRDLTPGTLRLVLSRDGYETRFFRDVELAAAETKVLDLELVAAARLHLHFADDQGRAITGPVTIGVSRVGESRSLGTSIRAGGDGRTTYDRISPGRYQLTFGAAGFAPARVETTIQPGDNSLDVVLRPVADLDPVGLQGVVRDAKTGDPLPEVQVRFSRGMTESVTDQSGTYRFRGLRAGTYALFFMLDGYGFHMEKGIVVEEGEATTRDVALKPAAVLHLRVTDAHGRPAVGQVVFGIFAHHDGGTRVGTGVTVDERGEATYRRILPGRYKLTVTREGLRAEVETEILPGENRLEFQLK